VSECIRSLVTSPGGDQEWSHDLCTHGPLNRPTSQDRFAIRQQDIARLNETSEILESDATDEQKIAELRRLYLMGGA
jgi:hypothetical protein